MGTGTVFGLPDFDDRRAQLAATLRRCGGDLRLETWRVVTSASPGSFLGGPALGPLVDGIDEIRRLILAVADDLDRAAARIEAAPALAAADCPPGALR